MEKMMMPAYYNVLSTEEMTYTEGGANATMSEALLCWLIPPYGWFKGVTAVRDYRRKNPNTWMEKGLDALATDMEKSTANTIRDLACAAWFVTSTASGVGLVINAAVILLSSISEVIGEERFLVCENYLIFYHTGKSVVTVDRVLYGRRDYLSVLFDKTREEPLEEDSLPEE